jgi:putative transposase
LNLVNITTPDSGGLRSAGIFQSMSRSGNCYDNACAEHFFSHFKEQFLRSRQFDSVEGFTDQLAAWITWFNTARLSEKRGGTSPLGYRVGGDAER